MVDSDKDIKEKDTKDKVSWTSAQEAALVALLLNQMKQGNQAESGWKPIVWTAAVSMLQKDHPSSVPKKATHCKSRWQRLKTEYKQVKEIREQSGFGWADSRQIVTAEPEVWQSFLQAHPKLGKWHTKSFPLYQDISTIVGDVIATGQHVFHTNTLKLNSPEASDIEDDDSSPSLEEIPTKTPKKRNSAAIDQQSSWKRHVRLNGADAIKSVSEAVETLASALMAPEPSQSQGLQPSPVRRTKAFQVAEEEEGLSDNELVDVAILFEKDTSAADMYLAMRNKKTRQLWLRKKLDS